MIKSMWWQKYTVRRFNPQTIENGHVTSTYTTFNARLDVQENTLRDNQASTGNFRVSSEGLRSGRRLVVYGDVKFNYDLVETGQQSDWIYYDGFWWKCMSCVQKYKSPLLPKYRSTFTIIPEGESTL